MPIRSILPHSFATWEGHRPVKLGLVTRLENAPLISSASPAIAPVELKAIASSADMRSRLALCMFGAPHFEAVNAPPEFAGGNRPWCLGWAGLVKLIVTTEGDPI